MSKPSFTIFPIQDGRMLNNLDAAGFQIINVPDPINPQDVATKAYADAHGGGGGGGGGNDTGTTTAILKGDGNHGFADAVAGTDYLAPSGSGGSLSGVLKPTNNLSDVSSASTSRTNLGLGNVDNTADTDKPVSTDQAAAIGAKADAADLTDYITSNDAAVALKANTSDVNTALAAKADITYVDSSISGFTGSTSVTTLGTITTGTWNGTALGNSYVPALNGIAVPTGSVNLNSQKIIGLADPTSSTDAANKQYVDSVAITGPPHPAVIAATTVAGTLASSFENGDTIDGIVLATGNRILIKNQAAGAENGIYTVNASGAPTRATDADTGSEVIGSVFVSSGTVNAGSTWAVTTIGTITINVTAIAYTQTAASTVYSATGGITLSGSQFSLSNINTNKLMGRYSAGVGSPQEISISTGLALDASGNLTASGTGTVTSVSLVTTNSLFNVAGTSIFAPSPTSGVANSTSTPAITLSPAANIPANTFYGNSTALTGSAAFMSATSALTSLGGTTVGQNIFKAANPSTSVYRWVRLGNPGVDGTSVTFRTQSETLGDLGAESALTFASPLIRGTGTPNPLNQISIPAATGTITGGVATGTTSGHLTATDWADFKNKLSSSFTLTTTAPLTIDNLSSANFTQNRTLAMPAATGTLTGSPPNIAAGTVDGYLSKTDWADFKNKPPNSRTISTVFPLQISNITPSGSPATYTADLSANRTLLSSAVTTTSDGYLTSADYNKFLSGAGGTVAVYGAGNGTVTIPDPTSPNPPVTRIVITPALSANLNITIPSANLYSAALGYPYLEISDIVAGGAQGTFSITITAKGANQIDTASSFTFPKSMRYLRLYSDGATRWSTTRYYVQSLVNPTNAAGIANFNTNSLTGSTPRTIAVPNADSTLVVPTPTPVLGVFPGVVTDIDASGNVTREFINPVDLVPATRNIGVIGQNLSGTVTMTNDGLADTFLIVGNLVGAVTLKVPDAANYRKGANLVIVDQSGTVNATHPVTITSTNGTDTFNLPPNLGILFDEPNGKRVLTATVLTSGANDPAANWSVSSAKSVLTKPFAPALSGVGGVFTITADTGASGAQNAHITLASGANVLAVNGAFDGMKLEVVVVQPVGGNATLALPTTSYVANNPNGSANNGSVTLSTAGGAIDRLKCAYDGVLGAYLWDAPYLGHTAGALPFVPDTFQITAFTSSTISMSWVDRSTNETGFEIQRSTDNFAVDIQTVGTKTPSSPPSATGGTITFQDAGLQANTTYYYRVYAKGAAGNSSTSTAILFQTTTLACTGTGDVYGSWPTSGSGFTTVSIGSALNGSQNWVATGGFIPSAGKTSPCKITVPIYKVGAPNPSSSLTAYIYDVVGTQPGASPVGGTSGISTNSIPVNSVVNVNEADALGFGTTPGSGPLAFGFSGLALTPGHTYYVVVATNAAATSLASTNCYKWITNANQLSTFKASKSGDGITWVDFAPSINIKAMVKTFI